MMANSGDVMTSMTNLVQRLKFEYKTLHNAEATHLVLGLEDLRVLRHSPDYKATDYSEKAPTDEFMGLKVIITWEKHGIMVGKPWYVQGI